MPSTAFTQSLPGLAAEDALDTVINWGLGADSTANRWTGREDGEISDAAWSVIEPLLPPVGRARGRWRDHRQVLEGIV